MMKQVTLVHSSGQQAPRSTKKTFETTALGILGGRPMSRQSVGSGIQRRLPSLRRNLRPGHSQPHLRLGHSQPRRRSQPHRHSQPQTVGHRQPVVSPLVTPCLLLLPVPLLLHLPHLLHLPQPQKSLSYLMGGPPTRIQRQAQHIIGMQHLRRHSGIFLASQMVGRDIAMKKAIAISIFTKSLAKRLGTSPLNQAPSERSLCFNLAAANVASQ